MTSATGWIGVDLDGTLATYDKWVGPHHIGEPIKAMVDRVKQWLKEGREVRIFTARVYPLNRIDPNDILCMRYNPREQEANAAAHVIRDFCAKHLGKVLTITCVKDQHCDVVYDDRARQVEKNTGRVIGE